MWSVKQLIPVLATSALFLLAGCQYSMTDAQIAKYRTVHPEPVNVAIGPRLAALTDRVKQVDTFIFPTGHVAAEMFAGKPACPWTVELLSSQLSLNVDDTFMPITLRITATYHISCLLTGPDSKVPLSASRTGQADWSFEQAITLAVGGALDDIAGQVRACIQPASGTNTRSPTHGSGTALPNPR